ncbi:MAG: hypothetical protein HOY79_34255 [Streptomyces sp.]|nr:hypothetical protein [Streptomyces sp.]NUS11379.1 hypothetical protein [Streptomyces sp.]NUS23480.1 hypothetical protein [Streptomyces sp.]
MTRMQEAAAAEVRDATLDNLLSDTWPWDVDHVKRVILALAREKGEISANDVRDRIEQRHHWLIGPAFNSLTHSRTGLVNTGRRVPSTSPGTKGHGVSVYCAPASADDGEVAA